MTHLIFLIILTSYSSLFYTLIFFTNHLDSQIQCIGSNSQEQVGGGGPDSLILYILLMFWKFKQVFRLSQLSLGSPSQT